MKLNAVALAIPVLAAVALSGCDDGSGQFVITPEDEAQINADAKSSTLLRLTQDQEEARTFLKQIQASDPKFVDAYYRLNDRGNKEMMLVKDLGDGNMVEYPAFEMNGDKVVPASIAGASSSAVPAATTTTPATGQSATSGESSVMPALLGGMLAGAVLGHMASNSMQGTVRPRAQQEEEKRRTTSSYAGTVASNNTTAARSMATSRAAARASGASAPSSTAKSGAFGSSGARAGGYSAGTSSGG